MARLDRAGVGISYAVHAGGPGVPVLLTHGFSATGEMHAGTIPALVPDRTCITWDVRGHGETDSPVEAERYSIPLTLDDMAAILDAEGVERAVLLGHSMGGYLSLRFQRVHPERVAALVLVGTGPGYRRDDARNEWNEMCEAYARDMETKGFGGLPSSEEVSSARHRSVDGLIHAARGILRQHDADVLDHLAEIDVPVLLVAGSDDRPFVEAMRYMAGKIPRARHAVIDGAGHVPMLTHPAIYNEIVAAFLEDIDPVSREDVSG